MSAHAFALFADYHQFYLWDPGAEPRAPEDYTDEDVRRLVKVGPNVVVIQPVRNMTVAVELELCDRDPGFNASQWDHIAECGLDLPTGKLQVHECTGGPVLDLDVTPGSYRLRALFGGLGTISENGLDGKDFYAISLWPEATAPLRIVKQWEGRSR